MTIGRHQNVDVTRFSTQTSLQEKERARPETAQQWITNFTARTKDPKQDLTRRDTILRELDKASGQGNVAARTAKQNILRDKKLREMAENVCADVIADAYKADRALLGKSGMTFLQSKLLQTPPVYFALGAQRAGIDMNELVAQLVGWKASIEEALKTAEDVKQLSDKDREDFVKNASIHLLEANENILKGMESNLQELRDKQENDPNNAELQKQVSELGDKIENQRKKVEELRSTATSREITIKSESEGNQIVINNLKSKLAKLKEISACLSNNGMEIYNNWMDNPEIRREVHDRDLPFILDEGSVRWVKPQDAPPMLKTDTLSEKPAGGLKGLFSKLRQKLSGFSFGKLIRGLAKLFGRSPKPVLVATPHEFQGVTPNVKIAVDPSKTSKPVSNTQDMTSDFIGVDQTVNVTETPVEKPVEEKGKVETGSGFIEVDQNLNKAKDEETVKLSGENS